MKILARLLTCLLTFLLMLATVLMVACSGGAPGCPQATFGSTTCTGGGGTGFGGGGTGGGGGGGGGGSTPTAFAYAADQNGSIDGFAFSNSGGTFAPISGFTAPVVPVNLGGIGAVVAQGQFLYVVFPELQQIYGYTIGTSGSLTALSGFPVSAPLTGIGSASYNQQVVVTNPAGTLLFVSEFGVEQILVYQISSAGALTPAAASPVSTLPAGLEPQNMAMDGLGRFLYVTDDSGDHSGSIVAVYSVSTAGALTLASTPAQTLLPCCWEMQGEPSGNYMLGISGETLSIFGSDDNHIYVYAVNQTTGLLTAVTGSPFATTYSPFNIAVDPSSTSGEFVYSFSVNDTGTTDDPIEAYQLNTTTGALTVVTGSPFSGVTAAPWGQFDQSGGYLFLYAGVNPDFELGVAGVGTTGALTESVSTTPLTTSGYWAVTDVPTQ